jgi:acetyltransferase-like isoleucine patch superfamily enzyme
MIQSHAGNYTADELRSLGLRSVGEHVQIHRTVQIFGAQHLSIGSRVRIDVFALLSAGPGGFTIEDHVHIASNASILGAGAPVLLSAFSGVSPRATLFTSTDDFSGGYLSGPTIPSELTNVRSGAITLGRHAIVGAGSIVLPGVTIGTAATVGALSLVKRDVEEFTIVAGNPLRVVGRRGDGLLELERQLLARERDSA